MSTIVEKIKATTLQSLSLDFDNADVASTIERCYADAKRRVERYLNYPLRRVMVSQYIPYKEKEVFLAILPLQKIVTEKEVEFSTESSIIFSEGFVGTLVYEAGYDELPEDIENTIFRITISLLKDYADNTINNSSQSKTIGTQQVQIQKNDVRVIERELEKIESYQNKAFYTSYKFTEIE